MSRERLKKMIILGFQQFEDPYYQGVAAQLAFFLFLSVLPAFILLSQVLGLFSLSMDQLQQWARVDITGEGMDALTEMLSYQPSGANSIFLALIALWAASRAQFALIRIANYTHTDGESTGEGYVKDRLHSIKTIIITLSTIVFSLVVLVYGPIILQIVIGPVVGSELADAAWVTLRWPLAAALYFFMISYNYYVLPSKKVPFKDIVPGSVLASLGFLAVTYFYNLYTTVSTNYNILYGSFSNIVVLLFWFWFMSWVMCLGLMFNRVWWATRKEDRKPILAENGARRKPLNKF
ncbi:MAG: YihY/virulence factor BrkB family protein [Firmicutes bacterium]|nr:YihY/virulence factor BrkB family protein [Bacillota bacterium]